MEIKLPDKSGIDLLKDVKATHPDTPVIIMSAVIDFETVEEALRRGASEYMKKPFRLDDVVFSVERALGYRQLSEVWKKTIGSWEKI